MLHLETPEELAEHLADRLGVYGVHGDESEPEGVTCTDEKPCRPCFVAAMADRIRKAVGNERMLKYAHAQLTHEHGIGDEGRCRLVELLGEEVVQRIESSRDSEERKRLEELKRKIPDGQASPL